MVKKGTFVAAFSWLLVLASLTMRTANAMPLFLRRLRKCFIPKRYHPVAVDILAAVLQGRIAAFCATRPSYEGLPFYK
ncbi:hypothetical protein Peur_043814 [Populus x canadensis]